MSLARAREQHVCERAEASVCMSSPRAQVVGYRELGGGTARFLEASLCEATAPKSFSVDNLVSSGPALVGLAGSSWIRVVTCALSHVTGCNTVTAFGRTGL